MTWTFTITGPDGQEGSIAMNEADEPAMIDAATKMIRECLAMPVQNEGGQGGTQERKIAGKRG